MHDPDLQTLKLFLSVHELGNITRASERNNITVSAVTKRLQDLEAFYRVRLFDRQARGVVPTSAGDELAHYLKDLLTQLERTKGTMSEFAQGIRGLVRVHANTSIIMTHLADAIAIFTSRHPMIRVDLQEAVSWSIVRNVFEGRADVGLVATSLDMPPELTVYPYRSDRIVAVVPRGHPLAEMETVDFEQLLDYEHVGIEASSALSVQLAEAATRLNRGIRHSYQVVTVEIARRMVAAGLGIAILPEGMVMPFREALGICGIPLSNPWSQRNMRICMREDMAVSKPTRLFVAMLMGEDSLP